MLKSHLNIVLVFLSLVVLIEAKKNKIVGPEQTLVYGDGLKPDEIVLPARYFFIHASTPEGLL